MIKQREISTALYLRLSRDDGGDAESNSIQTQRMMLQRYAREQAFPVYSEYVDDGISGTTFERDGFKRMIADIEAGRVNCVVCKDLSRLGRNNAMVAFYTEIHFMENNVRFIAINDGIDSAHGDNEIMPFKSVINEYYARDISKKVKSARRAQALKGDHTCGRAPYGYRKAPADKRKLVIDETSAEIVRKIFDMCLDGMGNYQIANRLCKDGIPTPASHAYHRDGLFHCYYNPEHPCDWHARSVAGILRSPVYAGHMANHRQASQSFKTNKIVQVPREEWIIVENTHEGIISQAQFDAVQKIISVKKRANTSQYENIFAGLLQCPDCGKRLTFQSGGQRQREPHFNCDNYRHGHRTGADRKCTPHHIRYSVLSNAVLQHINAVIRWGQEPDFAEKLHAGNAPDQVAAAKKQLDKLKRRDREIKQIGKKLLEQNALGVINDNAFAEMYGGYQSEQADIAAKCAELESGLREADQGGENALRFQDIVRKYSGPQEELTRTLLLDLVDSILVYESTNAGRGQKRDQEIKIQYRLIGAAVPQKL